jgi:hypothetical protein
MRSIDSLIEEGEIARPDLIKMDIQAGELAAKAPSRRFKRSRSASGDVDHAGLWGQDSRCSWT